MVDILGHLAFGALFALPAWFVWQKRVSITFIAFISVTSLLPDIDLWLSRWFPGQFHHHGVTHTIVFIALASVFIGAVAAYLFTALLNTWLGWNRFDRRSTFGFATAAFFLGGVSHIFADLLSAPDISQPIEPLWPLIDKPFSVDLLYYTDPLWNGVFLSILLGVHVALATVAEPAALRSRFRDQSS